MTMAIKMDQEVFSKVDGLFVLTAVNPNFKLTTAPVTAQTPSSQSGGIVEVGDGIREIYDKDKASVTAGDDDDDQLDTIISWSIVCGFILIVAIGCCIYCFICPCLRRRK